MRDKEDMFQECEEVGNSVMDLATIGQYSKKCNYASKSCK